MEEWPEDDVFELEREEEEEEEAEEEEDEEERETERYFERVQLRQEVMRYNREREIEREREAEERRLRRGGGDFRRRYDEWSGWTWNENAEVEGSHPL